MRKLLLVFCLLSIILIASEQVFVPTSMGLNDLKYAQWITPPEITGQEPGVYHFRKSFDVSDTVRSFIMHVSADNRYILYVNGYEICRGPARGDIDHWQFETVDITSHVKQGENVIAAVVWNCGEMRPWAQITKQTAFFFYSELNDRPFIYSDASWKVIKNKAYTFFLETNNARFPGGIGPGEIVDYAKLPSEWQLIDYNDSDWPAAINIASQHNAGFWNLVPRITPFTREKLLRFPKIRRYSGADVHGGFIKGDKELVIPAHKNVKILLDQTWLISAYPQLHFSKGKGAQIKMTYNEALFDKAGNKGHRDEIEGKELLGIYDVIYPDGSVDCSYRPLWYRAYRFVQLEIETKDEALILHDFYHYETGYPFQENAAFISDDKALQKIWDACWRTAKACAHETYMDCPYYEQLQYGGDTRIQGLISYAVTGDTRLMKQAIDQFYNSRLENGLTNRAYPGTGASTIPTFSLVWISMIYDYWMYTGDTRMIQQYADGIEGVIKWYSQFLKDGLITNVLDDSWDKSKNWSFDYWNYVDDTPGWPIGVPNGVYDGQSAAINLAFAYALIHGAELMAEIDEIEISEKYIKQANKTKTLVYKKCWDKKRKLLADTPNKKHFSQHVNILGILTDLFSEEKQNEIMNRIINDAPPIKCSLYYRYYMHTALHKAGLGDRFVELLDLWYDMLDMGYTTFPEHPQINARSDCHAWSAHPLIDFVRIICGVNMAEPGFNTIRIEPHLGPLKNIQAAVPHPKGTILVDYQMTDSKLKAQIKLPDGVTGVFVHNGLIKDLKSGLNTF